MTKFKIYLKGASNELGSNFQKQIDARLNGELVASTSMKVSSQIAKTAGKKNSEPFFIGQNSATGGYQEIELKGSGNTLQLFKKNGNPASKEISFDAAEKVKVKVIKVGILGLILGGFKPYKIKVKN